MSTTLFNVLEPIWGTLVTSGTYSNVPAANLPVSTEEGLVGSVVVIPYVQVVVAI